MTQPHEANKITPEYWGGYDICNEATFINEPVIPEVRLTRKEFAHAQRELRYGVGQVAAGNATEIRYQAGNVFDPSLEDGSLVVVDTELISRRTFDDPRDAWSVSQIWNNEPVMTRPYSEFWLAHQDYTTARTHVGCEVLAIAGTTYLRMLQWGVIMRRKEGRAIQPFAFDMTELMHSGKIYTPPIPRRDPELQEPVIPIPVNTGEVQIWPRLTSPGCKLDLFSRIRSIDVVYPAAGDRQPGQSRKQWRFGLRKPGINPA
ncbi:MAG TPA: hypothetical protein VLG11_00105 [Candidatus Saccharimonadales bacterium]|nr:hypothetical protein [Candidatus Saccharimonadales bacterium]